MSEPTVLDASGAADLAERIVREHLTAWFLGDVALSNETFGDMVRATQAGPNLASLILVKLRQFAPIAVGLAGDLLLDRDLALDPMTEEETFTALRDAFRLAFETDASADH